METLATTHLEETVRETVADYAGEGINVQGYFFANEHDHTYTVVDIPHTPRQFPPTVALMVRIEGDIIIIEEDLNDRPLYIELMRHGIPREKIILVYAGETIPPTS